MDDAAARAAAPERVLIRLAAFLHRQPRGVLLAAGVAWIGLLALLDWLAPLDLSFLIFYVGPVLFLLWFVAPWAGYLGAGLSVGFWFWEDVLSHHAHPSLPVADWNIAVRGLFLLLFVWVVAELKRALERVQRAAQERMERDVAIAEEVQRRLFPRQAPDIAGLDVHGVCQPAGGVAGDYYDFLPLGPGRLGIAVGDVAGKGLPAALLMASLQGAARSLAPIREGPGALLRGLNSQLNALIEPNRFATFFWGVYDATGRRLTWSNAGHNPPMLLRQSGSLERLRPGGPPLGVFGTAAFEEHTATLGPGDVLLIFTDGVTEATDEADEEFGEGRLERVLREGAAGSAREVCKRVLASVTTFEGGAPQKDDITLVAAKVK